MRKLSFFFFYYGFCLIDCQLSLIKNQECGQNEAFQTCGTACEPSCENPNPNMCTLQCVVGCQCEKGFVRNSLNACVSYPRCSPSNATTELSQTLKCGINEIASDCHSPCTEKKCPTTEKVMINCLMLCQQGCACKEPYYRNQKGQCVEKSECPVIDVVQEPRRDDSALTCANVRCRSKGGCAMVEPVGCRGSCELQPQCLDFNECDSHQCPQGTSCVLTQVVCIKAPCNPIVTCKPPTVEEKERKHTRNIRLSSFNEPSCMTARCGTPAGCAMVEPIVCANRACKPRPMCIHENACAATLCPEDHMCVLREATCIKAPCNPIAHCQHQERKIRQ